MTDTHLSPGTRLGAFEIVEFLAEGGMGAVYKARHRVLGELRAIKVIRTDLTCDPQFAVRFFREVRIAASVSHPNLVRTYDPAMEGDLLLLPMELLEGIALNQWLRDREGRPRPIAPDVTVDILLPVCDAVFAMHLTGVIHQDLKPANIFLSVDAMGRPDPKVLDFGAARSVDGSDEQTHTGLSLRTEFYMSPEQARGRKDLDPRTDQYALGVIAYQMLTGARPYETDDTGHALSKVIKGLPFRRPREIVEAIPQALEIVVLRALAHDRAERFPSVADLAAALQVAAGIDPSPPTDERSSTTRCQWSSA